MLTPCAQETEKSGANPSANQVLSRPQAEATRLQRKMGIIQSMFPKQLSTMPVMW